MKPSARPELPTWVILCHSETAPIALINRGKTVQLNRATSAGEARGEEWEFCGRRVTPNDHVNRLGDGVALV